MLSKILMLSAMLMNVESSSPSSSNSCSGWEGSMKDLLVSQKMALKKSIGRLCLTGIQLQAILIEIEAVVNSRSLVYVNNEVEHRTIITPIYFLSIKARTELATLMIPAEEKDESNFRLKESSST